MVHMLESIYLLIRISLPQAHQVLQYVGLHLDMKLNQSSDKLIQTSNPTFREGGANQNSRYTS